MGSGTGDVLDTVRTDGGAAGATSSSPASGMLGVLQWGEQKSARGQYI